MRREALIFLTIVGCISAQSKYENYGKVKYAAPIKSLTIFDRMPQLYPRDRAVQEAQLEYAREKRDEKSLIVDDENELDGDEGSAAEDARTITKASNEYKFVGIVNGAKNLRQVKWIARRRSKSNGGSFQDSPDNWSLRMVYIDPLSTARDMLVNEKVDLYASYEPVGRDPDTGRVNLKPHYSLREKSIRNVWNFRPKQFLTDKSGMKSRERRIRTGVYTDGAFIYEASYDYQKGKNVMKKVGTLEEKQASMSDTEITSLSERLTEGQPDIILERTTKND